MFGRQNMVALLKGEFVEITLDERVAAVRLSKIRATALHGTTDATRARLRLCA
jgi:hypothetical protein